MYSNTNLMQMIREVVMGTKHGQSHSLLRARGSVRMSIPSRLSDQGPCQLGNYRGKGGHKIHGDTDLTKQTRRQRQETNLSTHTNRRAINRVCVSGIHAQLCWLNLHVGKQQRCSPAWAATSGPQEPGWAPAAGQEGPGPGQREEAAECFCIT